MEPLGICLAESTASEAHYARIVANPSLKEALDVLVNMIREMCYFEIPSVFNESSVLEPLTSHDSVFRPGRDPYHWLINDLTHVRSIRIEFSREDRMSSRTVITIRPEVVEGNLPHGFLGAEFVLLEDRSWPQIDLRRINFDERWYS